MSNLTKSSSWFPTTKGFWDDLFDSGGLSGRGSFPVRFSPAAPAVNIRENGNSYTLEMAAPGMKRDDFNVDIADNLLTISASKEEDKETKDESFTRREYNFNSFARSFSLPDWVQADKIKANYKDGVLSLSLSKEKGAPESKKRVIAIN